MAEQQNNNHTIAQSDSSNALIIVNSGNVIAFTDSLLDISSLIGNEEWMETIWRWADEFAIPEASIPRDAQRLLNLTQLELIVDQDVEDESKFIGVHGSLPVELSYLVNLEKLAVNGFNAEEFLESVEALVNLNELTLNYSLDCLPKGIGDMTNLVSLDLSNNNLAKLPQSFSKLQKLESLLLKDNSFVEVPEVILNLASLQKLDLAKNEVASIPKNINQLINLEKLIRACIEFK